MGSKSIPARSSIENRGFHFFFRNTSGSVVDPRNSYAFVLFCSTGWYMVGTCGRYRLISSYFDHFRSFSWDSNRFSWVLLFAPTWILQHAIPLVQSRGCLGCKVSRCQRNLGTCRSWNRFLGHTSTRQDQLSVAGSVASPGWVALILKGSHEHPVSCLMCNNMQIYTDSAQICTRAVSQKFLSFYVGEKWPQIMCGCIAVCGSTLVLVMPRMILCNKRSRKTRDLFLLHIRSESHNRTS